ncbi:2-hydroxychromene-2-carboxylate isomerase [Variovorax sp. PAMC 28711]|uniref:2-hydroxychromene-2-carboxylate isomerase n=1 Tax=Variovorax sp. PAMC 28711 TaxID=1795631 RepID=UPI00078EAE38|nr:2-hydroxychromene-2-carboxylate isomerase [Variovorax sp. PAMC 28711]AMM23757.1 disulfide bond formation protein DsbA [Variovorax sp. PAMC 28711]
MALRAEFLFDFGSPNAYLSHRVLPQIEQRTGVRFEYVPILLGGLFKLANNRSPAEAFAGIANKQAYDALEVRRFIDHHELSQFRRNPYFPVNTLKIMRGACAAQKLGCFALYVEAVYTGMWERELDMADDAVIHHVLTQAGLDAGGLLAASQDAEIKAQLLTHTQHAFERGAFGSPSFFIGDQLFFGKDRLGAVEDEILRQQKEGRQG